MRKILPYILITAVFAVFIWFFHPNSLTYRFSPAVVSNYLRSRDVEDPKGLIRDRITVSDSDIYIATGYLYATGTDPATYNFPHPPLIKYLFGFSTILFGNPYWVQLGFGLVLLWLTFFLGTKLKLGNFAYLAILGLLIDPVFGGMMNQTLLDLGQAVFSLGYLITAFFFPQAFILEGIMLGLAAASKFWSTTLIYIMIAITYKVFIRKDKIKYKKIFLTFLTALIVFALIYIKSFMNAGFVFNIFAFEGRVLKFMLSHNSATGIGGPLILFTTGYFAPWWQAGVLRAADWSFLWPISLIASLYLTIKTKLKDFKFFFYIFPIIYLLVSSTQVPFTRYFIFILPFVYLSLAAALNKLLRLDF